MISAANPSHDDPDPTVLVVEEDDVARSFLADNLEADRYRVRTADSREKALASLSVDQPDVIVVDVNGKTLDLIDAIRDGNGLAGRVDPDTPLIVLTTRASELHRICVLHPGADGASHRRPHARRHELVVGLMRGRALPELRLCRQPDTSVCRWLLVHAQHDVPRRADGLRARLRAARAAGVRRARDPASGLEPGQCNHGRARLANRQLWMAKQGLLSRDPWQQVLITRPHRQDHACCNSKADHQPEGRNLRAVKQPLDQPTPWP